jgi:hypothetical protein
VPGLLPRRGDTAGGGGRARSRRDRCVRAAPPPGPSCAAGRASQWHPSRGVLGLAPACRGLVLAAATTGPSPTSPGRVARGVYRPVPLRHSGLVAARVGGRCMGASIPPGSWHGDCSS